MLFVRQKGKLEKKRPDFFQVAIRIHPDRPWPKAFINSLSALAE